MPHVASGGERVRMETGEGTGKETRWRWGRKRPKGTTLGVRQAGATEVEETQGGR